MPIYEYRCAACGHTADILQRFSEPPLSTCPRCEQTTFNKQLSAPPFQLKGSGWYVTDFRDSKKKPGSAEKTNKEATSTPDTSSGKPSDKPDAAKPATTSDAKADSPKSTEASSAGASDTDKNSAKR